MFKELTLEEIPQEWNAPARWNKMSQEQAKYEHIYHTSLCSDMCTHPVACIESSFCCLCTFCHLKASFGTKPEVKCSEEGTWKDYVCDLYVFLIPYVCVLAPFMYAGQIANEARLFFKMNRWQRTEIGSSKAWKDGPATKRGFSPSSCDDGECADKLSICCYCCSCARIIRELKMRDSFKGSLCLEGNFQSHEERKLTFKTLSNWIFKSKKLFLIRRLGGNKMKNAFELWNVLVIVHDFLKNNEGDDEFSFGNNNSSNDYVPVLGLQHLERVYYSATSSTTSTSSPPTPQMLE